MKGSQNPLTKVLKKAQEIVEARERRLMADYGIPLYVTEGGRNALVEWPADPEKMSPEEMQILIETKGDAAVGKWLAEYYQAQEPQ